MKKLFSAVLSAVLILIFSSQALACTSFAVNSKQKLYGFNIDFFDSDMKIELRTVGDMKVFALDTLWSGKYYESLGMNSKGFFMGIQDLNPNPGQPTNITQKPIDINDFARLALDKFTTVEQARQFLSSNCLVNYAHSSHVILADKTGDSAVVESSENGNVIINGDKKFQVMTNFSNTLLLTKNYKDINCDSSDRYKIAYENIRDNFDSFNVDTAFDTLDKAKQNGYTLGSFVYDPENNEVYICWNKRYSMVWKVSMGSGTIETYKGFSKPKKMNIDANGIKSEDLVDYENKDLEEQRASAGTAGMNTPTDLITNQPQIIVTTNSSSTADTLTDPPSTTSQAIESAQPAANIVESGPAFNFDIRIIYVGIPALVVVVGIVIFILRKRRITKKRLSNENEELGRGDGDSLEDSLEDSLKDSLKDSREDLSGDTSVDSPGAQPSATLDDSENSSEDISGNSPEDSRGDLSESPPEDSPENPRSE